MLISIETYRNWDFPGRGSRPLIPPLDLCMFYLDLQLGPSNRSTYVVCVRARQDDAKCS